MQTLTTACGVALLALIMVSLPASSRGDDASAPKPKRIPAVQEGAEEPTRWYGYQTLITDGAALTLAVGGFSSFHSVPGLAVGGAVSYFFGAPIVHLVNGHADKALGSFAMRALPWAAWGLLWANGSQSFEAALLGGLLILGSIPASIAVDASVLAREEVPKPAVAWAPVVTVTPKHAMVGVGGVF